MNGVYMSKLSPKGQKAYVDSVVRRRDAARERDLKAWESEKPPCPTGLWRFPFLSLDF